MEAASVARAAQAHDITFVGLKAISDEANFEMPPMERFIASDGQFRTGAFVLTRQCAPALAAGYSTSQKQFHGGIRALRMVAAI